MNSSQTMAPVKELVKSTLVRSGLFSLVSLLGESRVVILAYHSVEDDSEGSIVSRSITHSAAEFEAQIRYVSERFCILSMDDVAKALTGDCRLPRKGIAITFDDGYRNNAVVAAPIMKAYGVVGTTYVTVEPALEGTLPWFVSLTNCFSNHHAGTFVCPNTSNAFALDTSNGLKAAFRHTLRICASTAREERRRYLQKVYEQLRYDTKAAPVIMNADDMRRFVSEGHIIGSHTLSHPNLAHVTHDTAVTEIADSKVTLETILGRPVEHFSYPHPTLDPHYTAATTAIVREAGYKTAAVTTDGVVKANSDPLQLFKIHPPKDLGEFRWKICNAFAGRFV